MEIQDTIYNSRVNVGNFAELARKIALQRQASEKPVASQPRAPEAYAANV